ncbi:MAG TPA: hypothetical protein VHI93_06795, partial [Candidatus Thermoplasmatota archaeon]|nr:hypothetical protein [Candidatus Thermoplasmatota archaeon]
MLARLAVRPDRALAVAALGTAAAILLPVAATLVLGTLAGTPARDQWVAYAPPGQALQWEEAEPKPLRVAAQAADGRMAYVAGDPAVARGARLLMPGAPSNGTRSATVLPLLHADTVLVHPLDLGPATPVAALFPRRPDLAGAVVAPARGADAFEDATGQDLADQGLVLTALSLPAVCLVAIAFARQEVRAQARRSATLAALGGARVAAAVAAARMAVMAAAGAALAAMGGFALYQWGPSQFHPEDAPRLRLALAIALPALAAAVGGVVTVLASRTRMDILRGAAQDVEADTPLPLPLAARPLLLGVRLLPVLLLAAALFAVDVGFPAAAARIPAALAGGPGEWVLGAERGLRAGQGVDARVADVAGIDRNVSAIVAETVIATLLQGSPAVLRGGTWAALSSYHGLAVAEGAPPGPLGDEGFVDARTGRELGQLPPGHATLVRFRPQTEAAADAVLRGPAHIQVTRVALEPAQPAAGSIARV